MNLKLFKYDINEILKRLLPSSRTNIPILRPETSQLSASMASRSCIIYDTCYILGPILKFDFIFFFSTMHTMPTFVVFRHKQVSVIAIFRFDNAVQKPNVHI